MENWRSMNVLWKNLRHNAKAAAVFLFVTEGILFILSWLCYDSLKWMLPLQILLVPLHRSVEKWRQHRLKLRHIEGFREILQSLMTSLQAGYSLENACRICFREVSSLYHGGSHPVIDSLEKIIKGMELHCPVEQLFQEYAEETQVAEICEFAAVLQIAENTGGNLVDVLKNTMIHLQNKMNASAEVRVSLSGRVFEKNIMLFMPLGVLLYLRLTNPEYVVSLYTLPLGNVMMTGILAGIVLCFFWTEKIMDIEF